MLKGNTFVETVTRTKIKSRSERKIHIAGVGVENKKGYKINYGITWAPDK